MLRAMPVIGSVFVVLLLSCFDSNSPTNSEKKDLDTVTVLKDGPNAQITAPDSVVKGSAFTIGANLSTPGSFGTIRKYEWSLGVYDDFKKASGGDTLLTAFPADKGLYVIVLRVTDDDGNIALDTHRVTIYREWVNIGAFEGRDISISQSQGTPYVAYQDGENGGRATVKKYDGNSWITVGKVGFSDKKIHTICIALSNGIPFVAYRDADEVRRIHVMEFNGSEWAAVGGLDVTGGRENEHRCLSLAVYDGMPIIAFAVHDGKSDTLYNDKGEKITINATNYLEGWVLKYDGQEWIAFDQLFRDDDYRYSLTKSSLAVSNGSPMVAFSEGKKYSAAVYIHNGSGWESLGGQLFRPSTWCVPTLALHNDTPYVTCHSYLNTVLKYAAQEWADIGIVGTMRESDEAPFILGFPSLSISDGTPYVAFQNREDRIQVKKYDGSDWVTVGVNSLRKGTHPTFCTVHDTLYLAYIPELSSDKLKVMAYR